MKILFMNGPNLNMLGIREKQIYGDMSLDTINQRLQAECDKLGVEAEFYQSNIEGELVDKIHSTYGTNYDGIVFNPGAYSHYSLALSDAIKCINIPVVEVHMSNVFAREDSRHQMTTAKNSLGVISGFGEQSYFLGLYALLGRKA